MRLTLALILAIALAAACGDDTPVGTGGAAPSAADLAGRVFLSTDADPPLVAGTVVRLTFDDESLGVNAGCNSMGGPWRIEDGALVVGDMFSTEMACEPELMDQDTRVATFLMSGPAVELSGDELVLQDADGAVIRFLDREVADPDRALVGTVWTIDTLISADAASSMPAGAVATLEITEDGRYLVSGPCNTTSGPVEVGDGTATFGQGGSTMMMCEPDVMAAEAAIQAVLEGERDISIEGPRLTITGDAIGLAAGAEPTDG